MREGVKFSGQKGCNQILSPLAESLALLRFRGEQCAHSAAKTERAAADKTPSVLHSITVLPSGRGSTPLSITPLYQPRSVQFSAAVLARVNCGSVVVRAGAHIGGPCTAHLPGRCAWKTLTSDPSLFSALGNKGTKNRLEKVQMLVPAVVI